MKPKTWENGICRKITINYFPDGKGCTLDVQETFDGGERVITWLPNAMAKSIGTALLRKPAKKRGAK